MLSFCGMVLVTTIDSMSEFVSRWMAGLEKIPCVTMAYTLLAPASFNLREWTPHGPYYSDINYVITFQLPLP